MLLGTSDQNVLLEHIRGPPLVIELHDRDTRHDVEPLAQSLFGEESQDDLIGTHAFSTTLSHHTAIEKLNQSCPFGIAMVDLGVLLSGQVTMELTVPVVKGPRNSAELANVESYSTGLQGAQIFPGDYLESGCELTLKIELMHPLIFPNAHTPVVQKKAPKLTSRFKKDIRKSIPVLDAEKALIHTPFNRMIYIISAEGGVLIDKLLEKVNEVNAKTLGLDSLPPDVLKAALSTYKITE